MIKLVEISAVLSEQPGFAGNFELVSKLEQERTTSPAALYAIKAVQPMIHSLGQIPILSFSGHPGVSVSVFEKARSTDGPLLNPGFARRSKRIHPFTLLTSLFNSVPAVVCNTFKNHGPCVNQFEIAPLEHFFPLLLSWLNSFPKVLILFSSAACREEEWDRRVVDHCQALKIEGSIAILLESGSFGPTIGHSEKGLDEIQVPFKMQQALDLGLALLWLKSSLKEPINVCLDGRIQSRFKWSPK